MKAIDMSGRVCGSLTVIERAAGGWIGRAVTSCARIAGVGAGTVSTRWCLDRIATAIGDQC